MTRQDRQITPHFRAAEFWCRCGRTDCDAVEIYEPLVWILEAARVELGRPIVVNSGVRCAWHNAQVGGSKDSRHVTGHAADVRPGGEHWGRHLMPLFARLFLTLDAEADRRAAAERQLKEKALPYGLGLYLHPGRVHLDIDQRLAPFHWVVGASRVLEPVT